MANTRARRQVESYAGRGGWNYRLASDCSELVWISASGRRISPDAALYLREEIVDGATRRQVWRGSLTEDTESEVTDEGVGVDHFALSPDGTYVAYSTHRKKTDAQGQASSYNEVHLTASDGSTTTVMVSNATMSRR